MIHCAHWLDPSQARLVRQHMAHIATSQPHTCQTAHVGNTPRIDTICLAQSLAADTATSQGSRRQQGSSISQKIRTQKCYGCTARALHFPSTIHSLTSALAEPFCSAAPGAHCNSVPVCCAPHTHSQDIQAKISSCTPRQRYPDPGSATIFTAATAESDLINNVHCPVSSNSSNLDLVHHAHVLHGHSHACGGHSVAVSHLIIAVVVVAMTVAVPAARHKQTTAKYQFMAQSSNHNVSNALPQACLCSVSTITMHGE